MDYQQLPNLEKKLDQKLFRLTLLKNKKRKTDTRTKGRLGKIFILSGILDLIKKTELKTNELIQIGAFCQIAQIDQFKSSILLGGLIQVVRQCDNPNFKSSCEKQGELFFSDHKKLHYPFSLTLGVTLETFKFLSNTENIRISEAIGKSIFEAHQQKKMQNKLFKAKEKLAKL